MSLKVILSFSGPGLARLYATTFRYDADDDHTHVNLPFDRLGMYCTVYLNGSLILRADNMLLPYQVPISKDALKPQNQFLLHFECMKTIAKELKATYGALRAGLCNLGDPSRVYVCKA